MVKMATEGSPWLYRCDLHIRDCYIAALIVSSEEVEEHVFTMWNWKSGECVVVSSLPYIYLLRITLTQFRHQHELDVFSYTFLDSCTPLLVLIKNNRLAFTARSPSLLGGANSKPKYLMFPDLSDNIYYDYTTVFLDSELPQPESYPSTSFSRATVPAHRDHGVVALWICTKASIDPIDDCGDGEHLVFFLREMLARLFQQEQEQESPPEAEGEGEASYIMDWDDWGPDASRWFDAPCLISLRWYCSVHGYRFVVLLERDNAFFVSPSFEDANKNKGKYGHPPHRPEALYLLVFDFNPRPLSWHQSLPETETSCPSSDGIGNLHVDVIAPSDNMFEDLESHFDMGFFKHTKQLACRVTLMGEPVDYDALVVCEDNIIGIQVRQKGKVGVAELS